MVGESEDKNRMSAFIEKQLNSQTGDLHRKQYIRGRAFYEFTKEIKEDLRFYRDIVYATEAQLYPIDVRYHIICEYAGFSGKLKLLN